MAKSVVCLPIWRKKNPSQTSRTKFHQDLSSLEPLRNGGVFMTQPIERSAGLQVLLQTIARRCFTLILNGLLSAALMFLFIPQSGRWQVQGSSAAQESVSSLEPGKAIERELAGGGSHSYQIAVASGQYLHSVVDQREIGRAHV